jgi:RNA polymerase sigma-70 factor (ECF subfamily)
MSARDRAGTPADRTPEQTALAELPERDRELLMLVVGDGLTTAVAARAAGCSPAAFSARVDATRVRVAARVRELEAAAAA